MMKKLAICLMFGGLLLLSACRATTITPQTPPAIVYGEDVCDHCGMIISDERFATALVLQTASQQYEHRVFDDIGDMLTFVQEANQQAGNTTEIVSYFVHDYVDNAWLDAQEAHYVQATTLNTPMGWGMAAFASKAAAEAQAEEWHTTVLDFAGALEHAGKAHTHEHS